MTSRVWTALIFIAVSAASSVFPVPAAVSPPHDRARAAMIKPVISGLHGSPVCLAVKSAVLPDAAPLAVTQVESLLADLEGLAADPSAIVLSTFASERVVPMSRCPEPVNPRHWYHVSTGPLRLIPPDRAQLVVSANMDGFPEIYLCDATLRNGQWQSERCTIVIQY